MALRLAKKTGNTEVTRDDAGSRYSLYHRNRFDRTRSAFVALKQDGHTVEDAALMAWYIGMATMVMIGIVKVILSFCGAWIQKVVPRAGLFGSLAGVGIALIGFIPLVDVIRHAVVGMLSLGLITLYAGRED